MSKTTFGVRTCFLFFVSCFFSLSQESFSQTGGRSVYSFLNIPASARIAAMGGTFIYVKDDDLNSGLQNPAALNPSMSQYLSLSAVTLPEEIKLGDAAYCKSFGKAGTFDVWMHYANYGNFKATDVTGQVNGDFTAADYALNFGWGYSLNKLFSVGANLKGIYSNYYLVSSTGLAADVAATYYDSLAGFTATVVGRNAGVMLKPYTQGNKEPLPAEIILAASERPKHVPARLSLSLRHMERWDLSFVDPNDASNFDALTGTYSPKTAGFFTKLLWHTTWGLELLLSQNFHIRASYNLERRYDLKVASDPSSVGLSFGAGIKISKFIISYGRAKYHLAGATNSFSIAANLTEFTRRK